MKRVLQTDLTPETGNCYSACISMITGIDLSEIPTFCANGNPDWWAASLEWLEERGWCAIYASRSTWESGNTFCLYSVKKMGVPFIVGGKSPRFDRVQHAVVFKGEKVYDPHPSGLGISGEPEDVIVLLRRDFYSSDDISLTEDEDLLITLSTFEGWDVRYEESLNVFHLKSPKGKSSTYPREDLDLALPKYLVKKDLIIDLYRKVASGDKILRREVELASLPFIQVEEKDFCPEDIFSILTLSAPELCRILYTALKSFELKKPRPVSVS